MADVKAFDGKMTVMTQARKVKEEEVERLHAKTFGAWANSHLKTRSLAVNNFHTDWCDGVKLIQLVEILTNSHCPQKYHLHTANDAQKIANITIAVQFINQFLTISVNSKDVLDGNQKVILALLWRLILHFHVLTTTKKVTGDTTPIANDQSVTVQKREAKKLLLEWVRKQTAGYPGVDVRDFDQSFYDGLAFCALVHKFDQNLIDFSQLTAARQIDNLNLSFGLAEKSMNIPRMLDAIDFSHPDPSSRPDEQCIMTYVSNFPLAFHLAGIGLEPIRMSASTDSSHGSHSHISNSGSNDYSNGNRGQASAAFMPPTPVTVIQPTYIEKPVPYIDPTTAAAAAAAEEEVARLRAELEYARQKGKVGLLKVNVIGARGLPKSDWTGKADPYVVLTLERQKEKTKKVKKTTSPTWNAEFQFYSSKASEVLRVEVFDHDLILSDDFLGRVEIPVGDCPDGILVDKWFPLIGKRPTDPVSGEINLQLLMSH